MQLRSGTVSSAQMRSKPRALRKVGTGAIREPERAAQADLLRIASEALARGTALVRRHSRRGPRPMMQLRLSTQRARGLRQARTQLRRRERAWVEQRSTSGGLTFSNVRLPPSPVPPGAIVRRGGECHLSRNSLPFSVRMRHIGMVDRLRAEAELRVIDEHTRRARWRHAGCSTPCIRWADWRARRRAVPESVGRSRSVAAC